ncbi:unnamed protein product [Adineta ricciae]|uniref:Mitotic checkpoint protein BUB3 n=1 Tax=Adineta ricciae TaxID=249248 RepID=A0A813T2W3_ADIRI|nr:unnamed protein product [Adineta ricciae]CAF1126905.1 unnamed protein product [Adineta ricciae]
MSEYQLQNPPTDGITTVHFSPNNQSQFLLASSWDASVRLYDVNQHTFRQMYKHAGPVLDCCFIDSSRTASGGLDRLLKVFDFNTQQEIVMGYHDNAIRCVHYSPEMNILITGSWDSSIKFWDSRVPNCLGTCSLPDKVYTLDSAGELLVVGTAQRKVSIWDLRKISTNTPIENRESNLKYQTRCIRCFPNKQGYVLSSIEGRVAVEFFDANPEIQKKKYAFKCHRAKEGAIENIYPVNAIAFHKQYGTFATGGSDAFVNMWDGANKKRLCQFHQYPAGITSLAFSPEGNMLAIASSYNYEYGSDPQLAPNDITKNNIFMVDETLFDYLHMSVVEYYVQENENDVDSAALCLSQIGYRVGYSLSERLSKENPRYRDELDTVKYLCKELWICLFKKQVDNLRTNHQGVYVIHDGRFRLLQQTLVTMNKPIDATNRLHTLYIAYSTGLLRGILTNMGYPCRVTAEIADFGVKFQIDMTLTTG